MYFFTVLVAFVASRDVKLSELFSNINPSEDMIAIENFSNNSQIQMLPLTNQKQSFSLPFQINAIAQEKNFGFYFYFGFKKINLTSLTVEKLSDRYYQIQCNQTLNASADGSSTTFLEIQIEKDMTYQWCVIKFDDRGRYEQATPQITADVNYTTQNPITYIYQIPNCSLPQCNQTFRYIYEPKIINFQVNLNSTLSVDMSTNINFLNLAYIIVIGNISARISYINLTRNTISLTNSTQILETILVKSSQESIELSSNGLEVMSVDQHLKNSYFVFSISYVLGENFQFENTSIDISVRLGSDFIFNPSKIYQPILNPFITPPFVQKQVVLAQNVPDFTQVIKLDQSSQIYKSYPISQITLKIKSPGYSDGNPNYENSTFLVLLGYVPLQLKQFRALISNQDYDPDYIYVTSGVSVMFDGANITYSSAQDVDLTNTFVYIYISSLNLVPFGLTDLILTFKFADLPFYYDLKFNSFQDCKFGSCSNLASLNFSGDVGVFWIDLDLSQQYFSYKPPQVIGRNYSYYTYYLGFQNVDIKNIYADYTSYCKCVFNRVLNQSDINGILNENFGFGSTYNCYDFYKQKNLNFSYLGLYCLTAPSEISIRYNSQQNLSRPVQNCPSGSFVTSNCQSNCVELTKNVWQSYVAVFGYNSNNCFKLGVSKKSTFFVQAINLTQPVTLFYTCIPPKSKDKRFNFQQITFNGIFKKENLSSCNLIFWSRQNLKVVFYDYSTNTTSPLPYYSNYCLNISQCFIKGNKKKFTNLNSNITILNIKNDGTNYFKLSTSLLKKIKQSQIRMTIYQLQQLKQDLLIQYQSTPSSAPISPKALDSSSYQYTFNFQTAKLTNYLFGVTYQPLSLQKTIKIGIMIG